jgi:hypothetical protein
MDTPGRFRGLAGWAVLAALLLTGLPGAARETEHVLLGIPGWLWLAVVLVAIVVAAKGLGTEAGAPLLGLGVPLVLLWTLGPVPGIRAVSGAPLLVLGAAGVVTLVVTRGWMPPRRALFPVLLLLYAGIALRVQTTVGPHGDEPHYLMVAESLLRDGDLELERDYAEERYRAFTTEALAPHYRVRGRGGAIYSVHAIGLSVLILPVYALGGYPAVSFFMALLAALLAREVRGLLRDAGASEPASEGVAWLLALSPPLVHFVGLVFTEVPAALVIARSLRLARESEATTRRTLSWAVPLALLPWFNVRYTPVTAILLVYALSARLPRSRAVLVVMVSAVSAVAIGAYHFVLYGFFDPRLVWGRRPEFALGTLAEGLPGLALDQEFGLLPYAPVLALCVAGFVRMARDRTRQAWAALALAAVVLGTAGSWHMWRGGFNPPARFLVPLLPVFALGLAAAFRHGTGSAAAMLAGWSLWAGALGAFDPSLVHRDRDGTAPFFRAWSGAEEWTRLLPGYVLPETAGDRTALTLVWASALGLAALARRRSPPTASGLATASVVLLGAAAVASTVSEGRTGGRDAVRLIGRPALTVPGWRVIRAADGSWGPEDLRWGTLYEPHRHPDGAEIGARLDLPAGRYRVDLEVEWAGPETSGPAAPQLEVRPEGSATGRTSELTRVPLGLSAVFEILPGEPAVSLRLRGGTAFTLTRLRLSTFS